MRKTRHVLLHHRARRRSAARFTSRYDVADRSLANGGDEEIRHAVPGEVHGQGAQVGTRGIAEYSIAGMPGKCVDEAQACTFGDTGQVDLFRTRGEVEDLVSSPRLGIGTGTVHEGIVAGAAPQLVRTATAVDDVVAGTAFDEVGCVVTNDQVVARAAEGVLDSDALGDGHVAHQAANVGERGLIEVDLLVLGKTGEVQGVVATTVPYREHQLVGIGRSAVEITPGVGVETVGGVAGAGAVVGTVELLDCGDVVDQRARRVSSDAAFGEVLVGVAFAPVTHDAVATRVLSIVRVFVRRVAGPGVVVARVSQAQGMADFVGQGLPAVVVHVRGLVRRVAAVGQVPRSAVVACAGAGQVSEGSRAILATAVVAEGHVRVTARGAFGKAHVGDIRPGLHGQYGLCFLLGVELAEPGDTMFVQGGRGSRGEEGVGQIDLAVVIHILVRGAIAQQVVRCLVHGKGRFAIHREVAATFLPMAEAIDLRVSSAGLRGRNNSFVFYF